MLRLYDYTRHDRHKRSHIAYIRLHQRTTRHATDGRRTPIPTAVQSYDSESQYSTLVVRRVSWLTMQTPRVAGNCGPRPAHAKHAAGSSVVWLSTAPPQRTDTSCTNRRMRSVRALIGATPPRHKTRSPSTVTRGAEPRRRSWMPGWWERAVNRRPRPDTVPTCI